MSKKVIGAYIGTVFILFLLLFYIGNNLIVKKDTQRLAVKYDKIEEWTRSEIASGDEGSKEKTIVYELLLPEKLQGRSNLAIYTTHQNIRVCIEEEEIYTLQWSEESNAFGKTPGIHWNFISLLENDCGKKAYVYVTSPYSDTLERAPDFYIGDKEAICRGIIGREVPDFIIDFLLFLFGIVLIVFWAWAYRGVKQGCSLLFLGFFAVILATWLGNDLRSTVLILSGPMVCTYLSYIALMILPVPFVLYGRGLFSKKEDKSGLVLCCLSLVQIAVSVILLVFRIKDFRETLFLVHGILVLVFAWVIYHIIKEIGEVGFSRKLKINIIGMASCAFAAVVDVISYYVNKHHETQILCALTFLIYISALGIMAMKETYSVLQLGKMAEKYHTMAYKDHMTGLYNRTAYDEMMNDPVVKVSGATIVMFDLNNLKKCNDVYGHEAGDSYIIQSAKIIADAFENVATCFRIGGDEFCAIIPEEKVQYCKRALENLQKKVDEANVPKREYKIHIAYGYATFDKKIDKELNDTRSRADAYMYRRKFAMKEETE